MARANDHLYEGQIVSKVTDAGHDFGALRDEFFDEFMTGLDLAGIPQDDFNKKFISLSYENNLLKRLMPDFVDMNTLVDRLKLTPNRSGFLELPYSMNPALKTCTVKLLHKDGNPNAQAIATSLTTADWVAFFGTGDLYVIIDAFNYNLLKALDDRVADGGINTYVLLPRELINDPAGKTYDLKKLKLKKTQPQFLLDQTPGNIVYTRNSHHLRGDSKQTFFSKFNVTLGPFSQGTILPLQNLPHIRVEMTDATGRVVDSTDDPHSDNQIGACTNTVYQYNSKFTGNERANAIAAAFQRKNSGDTLQGSVIDATDRIYYDQAYFDAIRNGTPPPPPHKLTNTPFVLTHDRVLLYDLLVNNRNALFSCMGPGNEEHSQKYYLYFSFTGVEDPAAKLQRYINQASVLIPSEQHAVALNEAIKTINTWIVEYAAGEQTFYDNLYQIVTDKAITSAKIIVVIQCFLRRIFKVLEPFTNKIDIAMVNSFLAAKTIENAEKIIQMYNDIYNIIKRYPNKADIENTYKSYQTGLYKNIPLMLREYGERVSKQSQSRNEAETKVLLAIQSHLKAGLTALDYQRLYKLLKDVRGSFIDGAGKPTKNKMVLDTFLTLLAAGLPTNDENSTLELIKLLPPEGVSLSSIAATDGVITPEETIIGIFADAAAALNEAKLSTATAADAEEASSALAAANAASVKADIDPEIIEQFSKQPIAATATPDSVVTAFKNAVPRLNIPAAAIPLIAESVAVHPPSNTAAIAATIISEVIVKKPDIDLMAVCKAAATVGGLVETGRNFASIVFGSVKSAVSNIANKIYSYRAWLSGQAGGGKQRGGGSLPDNVDEYCAKFIVDNYLSTLSTFISNEPNFNSATILTIQKVFDILKVRLDNRQLERYIFNILPTLDEIDIRFNEFSFFSKQVALQSLGLASGEIPVMKYHHHPPIELGQLGQVIESKYVETSKEEATALLEVASALNEKANAPIPKNTRIYKFTQRRKQRQSQLMKTLYNTIKRSQWHKGKKGSHMVKPKSSYDIHVKQSAKASKKAPGRSKFIPSFKAAPSGIVGGPQIGGRRTRRLRHTHKKRRPINK